jgi:hypothetical protein
MECANATKPHRKFGEPGAPLWGSGTINNFF